MTRYARVGEGHKRPLEASKWKDLKKSAENAGAQTADNENVEQADNNEKVILKKAKHKKKSKEKVKISQDILEGVENDDVRSKGNKKADVESKSCETTESHRNVVDAVDTNKICEKEQEEDAEKSENETKKSPSKRKSSQKPKFSGKKAKSEEKDYSKLECYNCHKKGHKVSDCPEPSDGKLESVECYKCGEKGHKSFKCPNKSRNKKKEEQIVSSDFYEFKGNFGKEWNKKTGYSKALREAWKAHDKSKGKEYFQFKNNFRLEWNKKTGFSKALREEWKKHGKELQVALKKQERSEQRRLMRQDKRESEKVKSLSEKSTIIYHNANIFRKVIGTSVKKALVCILISVDFQPA